MFWYVCPGFARPFRAPRAPELNTPSSQNTLSPVPQSSQNTLLLAPAPLLPPKLEHKTLLPTTQTKKQRTKPQSSQNTLFPVPQSAPNTLLTALKTLPLTAPQPQERSKWLVAPAQCHRSFQKSCLSFCAVPQDAQKSCSSSRSVPQGARSSCSSLWLVPQGARSGCSSPCSVPQDRSERFFKLILGTREALEPASVAQGVRRGVQRTCSQKGCSAP